MARLAGRTVLITGAAGGLGAAYAQAVAAEGAHVAICDLTPPDDTVAAIRATGADAFGAACDVTDATAIARLVQQVASRYGGLHGLVNNAALFASIRLRPFEEFGSEEFDRILRVNVRGTFECMKAVLPVMRAAGYGKIVNVASGTVFKGAPLMLPYVSSKGAVVALTRSVAREVGVHGIRVNCVAPGLTMSEGVIGNPDYTADRNTNNVNTRCLAREQRPEDLTGTVGFLLSAESDFMTGQTIVVDGGSAMH
ncbi:SDR family NAD(P)-dependent oxidoreductase [Roseomonas gilardii]|uniref:SDR family NAD(P)-dependent oxidoreductase n=1 Tax=Roseomonas gilardii TaxID=257708 RepID=UPI0004845A4B|nr:SDR family oxidoreductase [Roseomonas gilardii]